MRPPWSTLDNVLVLRSLAKAYGLAGARIGYLVVPGALAARFDALRLPLSVGLPTEALAVAAVGPAAAEDRRVAIMPERARLAVRCGGSAARCWTGSPTS